MVRQISNERKRQELKYGRRGKDCDEKGWVRSVVWQAKTETLTLLCHGQLVPTSAGPVASMLVGPRFFYPTRAFE